MNDIERQIIESGDPKLCYEYAKNFGGNVVEHSKVIALSNNLELNYLFARDIKKIDFYYNSLIILSSKDPYYNYIFARDVKNADILEHYDAILKSKNLYYIKEAREFIELKQEVNRHMLAQKHH